jgi:hypothetical protein
VSELDTTRWTFEEQHAYAEIQAELNRGIYLTHREAAKRRKKKADKLNSREDGAKRAHVGRSVPSGPARVRLLPLALAAVIGVVLWVLLFALVRWVGELMFGIGGKS